MRIGTDFFFIFQNLKMTSEGRVLLKTKFFEFINNVVTKNDLMTIIMPIALKYSTARV